MKIVQPNARISDDEFIIGLSTIKSTKTYGDAKSFYQTVDNNLSDDTIMYDVYRTTNETPSAKQDLMWGMTVLYPVLVNNECNMTRGHFHQDPDRSEVYYGFDGEGLLLLMDKDGNTWAEQVFKGSIHLIDGQHGHRLINTTSDKPLKVIACWSKHAGYDYEYVEQNPFSYRVFLEKEKIVSKPNK